MQNPKIKIIIIELLFYVLCRMYDVQGWFYIMSCLTFQAKLLLYRHYVFVLDLFHILGVNLYLNLRNINKFN
jgi:hypothetical protein